MKRIILAVLFAVAFAVACEAGDAADKIAELEAKLKTELIQQQRIDTLYDLGSVCNSVNRRDDAKKHIVAAIDILMDQLKDKTGAERAKALEKVEYAWRGRLSLKKEADEVATEILRLYREDLKSLNGLEMLSRRGDIRRYMIRMNRGQETDESKAWDVETRELAKAFVREIEPLDDDEWIKIIDKGGSALFGALGTDEEGRRLALEKIADRLFAEKYKGKKDPYASNRRYLCGQAANLAQDCQTEALRFKAADYYRAEGRMRQLGLTLYLVNHDLEGARQAFAAVPEDKEAQGLLAMIGDKPPREWQLGYAAQELTNWVTKISGKTPDLAKYVLGTPVENAEAAEFAKRHADDFKRLDDNDGFIIAEENGKTFIVGSRTKGVLNGVYRFLEKNSDIIWVRAIESEDGFGTVYTKNPDFRNTVRYLCDVPRYKTRHWSAGSYAPEHRWQARLLNTFPSQISHNMQAWIYRDACLYGDMERSVDFGIGLELVDCYVDSDPDIFPLIDGKRATWHDHQLCFMNPKTAELFAKEAVKLLKGEPKRIDRVSLGLGDNWSVCTCERCLKPIVLSDGTTIDKDAPNFRSTQYAVFANAVYAKLKEAFPYLKPITAPAYIFTAKAPAVKYPGGGGMYCPYIKNHKKPVYDDGSNANWHQVAEDFKKAGMPFTGLYEYNLCSSTPEFYHATMEILQKDLAYYGDALETVYLDGGYADGPDGVTAQVAGGNYEASAIEFWVCSRLMWDPKIDLKAARREFCRRAYHGAADIMAGYYEKLAEIYNADPAGCFWNDDPVSACKHYVVENDLGGWLRETLAKAEQAATDPRSKELIGRHRRHMEWLVERAEKAPKRVTVNVAKTWTELDPITHCGDVANSTPGRTRMWVRNDNEVLEFKIEAKSAAWRKTFDDYKAAGKVGTSQDDPDVFDWCNCVECFIDGRFAEAGSYFHLGMMLNERMHTGFGTSPATEPTPWTAKVEPIDGGVRMTATWPLKSLGVDISKGNKVNAMFVGNGDAWNGGQQHAPTSFQTLVLNMD